MNNELPILPGWVFFLECHHRFILCDRLLAQCLQLGIGWLSGTPSQARHHIEQGKRQRQACKTFLCLCLCEPTLFPKEKGFGFLLRKLKRWKVGTFQPSNNGASCTPIVERDGLDAPLCEGQLSDEKVVYQSKLADWLLLLSHYFYPSRL